MAAKEPTEVVEDLFTQGMMRLVKIMLSAQEGFTFTASKDLIESFPYQECQVAAERTEHETTFILVFPGDMRH